MAIPFDLGQAQFAVPFMIEGNTPDGSDARQWVPAFNGRILGGWAAYQTAPSAGATAAVTVEVGTGDALEWTFTNSDTNGKYKAGTLQTPDTALYFDTDDVIHLDVTSANKSEATLNIWLLVRGR